MNHKPSLVLSLCLLVIAIHYSNADSPSLIAGPGATYVGSRLGSAQRVTSVQQCENTCAAQTACMGYCYISDRQDKTTYCTDIDENAKFINACPGSCQLFSRITGDNFDSNDLSGPYAYCHYPSGKYDEGTTSDGSTTSTQQPSTSTTPPSNTGAAQGAQAGATTASKTPAGSFKTPIQLQQAPTTTAPQTLANGNLQLSNTLANICGYSASTFATQNKQVFAYHETGASTPMTFILCNSASFTQNFWLLSCPKQLTDVAGADAGSAGCKCQLADDQRPTCPSGSISGFQGTIRTQPGYWYYVVVQANPPDTGKDASRTFTVAAQPTVEGPQQLPTTSTSTSTQQPPNTGPTLRASQLVHANSVSDAIASAKTDAYKTVYIVTNSNSAAAGDIRNLMNTYAPPTVSGASSTYECGNIPDTKEIRIGWSNFAAYQDVQNLLNNILSAFAPLELTTDTSSFPNGQRDPRCNPDQWCCNGANGAEKAVSWLCLGPSSISGAGGKDLEQAKTILDACGVLRVILPKADRRGGKNLDVPSLLAYCDSNQQYIAGWGAFLIDCGICGRQEALYTSDSLASTALTALQNAVGDLAVGVGCVATAVEGTRINELTVTCGRSLADRDAICSS